MVVVVEAEVMSAMVVELVVMMSVVVSAGDG